MVYVSLLRVYGGLGPGGRTERLRTSIALTENLSPVFSTHNKQLSTSFNSSSGESDILSDFCMQLHTHTHSYIVKNETNL